MSELVISYLRYLQEVSRKMLLRSKFENVLLKSRRENAFHFNYEEFAGNSKNLQKYLDNLQFYLQRKSDKGLYLGLGLFVGQVAGKRKTSVAAPLFFCAVDVFSEEGAVHATHEVDWDSMALNYDLFTLIMEQKNAADDGGSAFEAADPEAKSVISPARIKVLNEVEQESGRRKNLADYQQQLLQGAKLLNTVKKIKSELPEFSEVTVSGEPFDIKKLDDLVLQRGEFAADRHGLIFFDHRFLFVAAVPEQLATYVALRELIDQVEG